MELAIYTAPPLRRLFALWPQKSPRYRAGFVFRFWWIGISFRYGFIKHHEFKSLP